MNVNFTTDTKPFENLGLINLMTFSINNYVGIPTNLEYGKVYYRTTNGRKELIAFKVFACAIFNGDNNRQILKYLVQYAGETNPIWEKGTFETNGWLIFTSKEHYLRYVNDNTNTIKPFDIIKEEFINIIRKNRNLNCNYGSYEFEIKKTYIISKYDKKPVLIDSLIQHILITEQDISICIGHNYTRWNNTYNGYSSYDECMNAWLNNFKITDFEETTFNLNIEVKVTKPVITTLKISEI